MIGAGRKFSHSKLASRSFLKYSFNFKLYRAIVKNPGPEDPALIAPHRGGVCSSNGMLEWWNNAILGIKIGYDLDLNP